LQKFQPTELTSFISNSHRVLPFIGTATSHE
jgi:hypothetical protein